LAIRFDKTLPSHITDAEVSSQEDSIPRMYVGTIIVYYKDII